MAGIADEAKKQTANYFLAGVAVAVGLAWNEAIKKSIDKAIPLSQDSVNASFIYAIVLTGLLIVISMFLLKIGAKPPAKCVCADNEEVKRVTLELNDKIDRVIYQRGLESTGLV